MVPLLKRNLYVGIASLAITAVMLAIIVFIKPKGIVHLPLLLLTWVAMAASFMVSGYLTRAKADQPVVEDERDKAVTSSVPKYQFMGVFLTAAAYIVVLLMLYESKGKIPMAAFYFMSPSVMMALAVCGAIGVMIEYWRANSGFVLTAAWRVGILMALVLLAMIAFPFAHNLGPEDSIPQCDIQPRFTSTHTEVHVGDPVRFVDTSVGDIFHWSWDFGDGSDIFTEQNPTHIYNRPGRYTVELFVQCPGGMGVEVAKENYITVLP